MATSSSSAKFPGHLACLCLWALTLTATGCGGDSEYPEVRGRVLIDGEPLTTGYVNTLTQQGPGARGPINSRGEFSLSTPGRGTGASIGTHHVAVVAIEQQDLGAINPEAPVNYLIPRRYADPETSGLEIEVVPGGVRDVILEISSQ